MIPFQPEVVAATLQDVQGLIVTPDCLVGLPTDPRVESWLAKAQAGEPVSVPEHNAMVAALAYMEGVFALGEAGETSFDVRRDPTAFVFGGSAFSGGTIVAPAATSLPPVAPAYRDSGDAAAPPAPPAPPSRPEPTPAMPAGPQTLDARTRRDAFVLTRAFLDALVVRREQVRLVVSSPASTEPAGLPVAVPWIIGGVVLVIVAGIGAKAIVDTNSATQQQITQRVKIQEDAHTARAIALNQAKLDALQRRLAGWQATGRLAPPAPIESEATPVQPSTPAAPPGAPSTPQDWMDRFLAQVERGAAYLAGGTLLVVTGAALADRFILPRLDRALGGK